MSPKAKNVIVTALRLPREERAFLAAKLLESLDDLEPFEVSDVWRKEIRRRLRELSAGKVKLVPGEQVFDEITREFG